MLQLWKKAILCLLTAVLLLSVPVRAEKECPDYRFTSIAGETITPVTNAGKTTLIIFDHLSSSHGNVSALIESLMDAAWSADPNLSILLVDWMGSPVDQVRQFAQPYGDADITFCTDEGGSFFLFLEALGLTHSSFSTPLSIVVDRNGAVKGYMMGENSEIAFRTLLHGVVDGIDPVPMTTVSLTGKQMYSQAYRVVELINEQRKAKGLAAVTMDKALLDAAMLRAAECAAFYSHTRPNGSRCFTAFPTKGGSSAENIAIGQQSAEDVMDAWMNSEGHRANILTEDFASVGVGVFCHEGVLTWVQLFSSNAATAPKKPADATKTVKIEMLQEHIAPRTDPLQLELKQNTEKTVSFYFANKGFDYQRVRPDSENLTFASSDPAVAKVDEKGVVTGLKPGTAEITITLTGTDKRASISVTVSEHNYDLWKYTEATCAEPGSAEYKCADCGDRITREIPKLTTHSWDGGTLIQKPTTEKEGSRRYTCTVCGGVKTESIPKYSKPKPAPTQPPTEAPTKAPTVPETEAPTVPATKAPTAPTTVAQPLPTAATTQPATEPTEPTAMPIPEPTEMPTELLPTEPTEKATEPMESAPEFVPATQPTQAETELSTQPENPPEDSADHKLVIAILVAAVAAVSAGAFLIFWKRKK